LTGSLFVTDIEDGDYIRVKGADLQKGASAFAASVAPGAGGTIEIRLDSAQGALLGTCTVPKGNGNRTWTKVRARLTRHKGIHSLVLVFKGTAGQTLFDFDWWKMDT
jgi:hypothetical protein